EQDDAVDRIAADGLLNVHGRQIAKQHRRGPQLRLPKRHDRELEGEAACLVNTALDELGELAEMPITRCQLRPRVADTVDWPAIQQVVRIALVLEPAAMHEPIAIIP